nr:sigma-70 family RNA polymerase sigma factor [Nocardiopsis sinuspersici]
MNEHESFKAFFKSEYTKLVGLLLRTGASHINAEDTATEAMIAVFEKWDRIENPRAYARRVALRQMTRFPREEPSLGKDDVHDDVEGTVGSGAEAVLDISEQSRMVMRLLRSLPRAQREVMALIVDGHTITEIAELLSKDVATVRSNLRHARRALKVRLEEEGLL